MADFRKTFAAAAALLALLPLQASAQELVTNGSFETLDFSGWTQFGNTGFTQVSGGGFAGSWAGGFGPSAPGGIVQDLATVAGQVYTVRFALENSSTEPPVSFSAEIGGTNLLTLSDVPYFDWKTYQFSYTATAATTPLRFTFRNDASFWSIDAISVQAAAAVPEPASWAMMIAGIGMAGTMLRRRRPRTASAAA